MVTYSDFRKKK